MIPLASRSKVTSICGHRGRRWDTSELEFAQKVVVLGALTLTLEDLDKHTRWLSEKVEKTSDFLWEMVVLRE